MFSFVLKNRTVFFPQGDIVRCLFPQSLQSLAEFPLKYLLSLLMPSRKETISSKLETIKQQWRGRKDVSHYS